MSGTNPAGNPFGNKISMPLLSPLYPPPIMEYRDCWAISVTFRTSKEAIRALVPAPLEPNPDCIVSALVDDIFASGFGRYKEFSLVVPVTYKGRSFGYMPYVIVDNDVAFAAGREIWGVPKKMGRIEFRQENGVITGTVDRGGIQIAKAAVVLETLADPAMLGGSEGDYAAHKIIPSVTGGKPDVNQITGVHVTGLKYHKVFQGPATLEFGTSPADPLQNIPVEQILMGLYVNCDRTLPFGEVVHDFNKG